jgi:[ribosomal protein S5]-alanine N-acetyltransferase
MTAPNQALAVGPRVYLRRPGRRDAVPFLAAANASAPLHERWVQAPTTLEDYARYVARFGGRSTDDPASITHLGLLACNRADDALVGVFNISEVVRGVFQSAYLGYYALSPYQGQGFMAEGIVLALDVLFQTLRLHRVEVNVQPTNARSITLARKAGFEREGYSRRYVKIGGRWRDHERWALLVEDWRTKRRGR